jgi:transcriptional regulator with XRE-family HTH domain
MSEKFFVGARLRRLRTEHGLSQSRMADKIDISSSYLNLLESNQRPLSISVLMKINEKFDIDIKMFTRDQSPEIVTQLFRVLSDPININTPMTKREIADLANGFPNAAQSMINMYDRFNKTHEKLSKKKFVEKNDGLGGNPFDVIANVFLINSQALELVEASAEKFLQSLSENKKSDPSKPSRSYVNAVPNILPQLVLYADYELDLRIRFMPAKVLGKSARLYDPHKGEILINESETNLGRQFHLLVELGLLIQQDNFENIVRESDITGVQTVSALKLALAGYFSGATLFPRTPFVAKREVSATVDSQSFSKRAFYFSAGFAALGNKSGEIAM